MNVIKTVLSWFGFFKKWAYFNKKLRGVKLMLWDREFKLFKFREMREDLRKEYDRNREIADAFQEQLRKGEHKKEAKEALEKNLTDTRHVVVKIEEQIKALDEEMGDKTGTQAEINGLHELRLMLVDYMKRNV